LWVVRAFDKGDHQGWAYFQVRLAFTMAAFNTLVQGHGFEPLSMAEFSL